MGELKLGPEKKTLEILISLIYRHTGIHMTERKENMILARLKPRLTHLKLDSIDQYIEYLESHSEEVRFFIDQVTTNETTFFRTTRIWEYFSKVYLHEWKQQHADKCLRIWSAAASSGEEAHSIAMSCLEEGVTDFRILGTDISQEMVSLAHEGLYTGRNLADFEGKVPELKAKYFDVVAGSMRAKKVLKDHLIFRPHNLFNPLQSEGEFDIIFLRNVLIYFNNEDQTKVLQNISMNLKKGGILILGEAESIFRLQTSFKFKAPLIYTKE